MSHAGSAGRHQAPKPFLPPAAGLAPAAVAFAILLGLGCDQDIHLGALPSHRALADGSAGADSGSFLDDDGDAAPVPGASADAAQDSSRRTAPIVPGVSWQWQIAGTIDMTPNAGVFDIDLFDAPATDIQTLHATGHTVLCFFSAGTRESFRPDASLFDDATVGAAVSGAARESWLDVRAESVRQVMLGRLDLAVRQGCDGVQPSGVDGFDASGFGLTAADEVDYVRFLAREAHARGLSVGLTNTVEIASAVEPNVDFALNQGCLQYRECERLEPFVAAGKAVLHVELVSDQTEGAARQSAICNDSQRQHFSTIIKTAEIGSWRLACP